jgi:hypothetical protein
MVTSSIHLLKALNLKYVSCTCINVKSYLIITVMVFIYCTFSKTIRQGETDKLMFIKKKKIFETCNTLLKLRVSSMLHCELLSIT